MSRGPLIALTISIALVLGIFFLLPTKDKDQKAIEKSRALSFETISIPVVLQQARAALSEEDRIYMSELEAHEPDSATTIENLKTLSREWFSRGEWLLAGHYAEKVADKAKNAEAWGISGSTFALGMQRYKESDEVEFAKKKAIESYEKAISLDPQELEYQVNLAVCYAERPDSYQPMQGIMMLLDLDKKYPNSPKVLNTLAYYGIQTGQLDKAEARLIKVLEQDPDNSRANCLMVRLLEEKGESDKAVVFQEKCNN